MGEWKTMESAPKGVPVTVYASYDPDDPLMTWREFVAQDDHGLGWWKTIGRTGLRVFPTHWKPLEPPGSTSTQGDR